VRALEFGSFHKVPEKGDGQTRTLSKLQGADTATLSRYVFRLRLADKAVRGDAAAPRSVSTVLTSANNSHLSPPAWFVHSHGQSISA